MRSTPVLARRAVTRLDEDPLTARLELVYKTASPSKLLVRAVAAVAALAAMLTALAVAAAAANDALDVIGHEAGPQVVATTDLYFALSDADAQVATLLLLGTSDQAGTDEARARYDQRRGEIAAALLEAHRLAGDDAAQRTTIETVMEHYGRYEQLAAEALLLAEQAAYPQGEAPPDVVAAYREAGDLMSGQLLPLSYNLTLENATAVREAYDRAENRIDTGLLVVAVAGAIALAALVWLQIHLARGYGRVFNPSLLVATAVCLLYLGTGLAVLNAEQSAQQTAKEGGFDNALSLARANAVSNALYVDQVRYLLDAERAAIYEQTLFDKAQALHYREAGNLGEYRDLLAEAWNAPLAAPERTPGLLSEAFTGSDATWDAARAWQTLMNADAAMREGDGTAAERLASVREAYIDYDTALAALSEEHLGTFRAGIEEGEQAIADFAFLLPAAMVALAAFTFTGIAPRLREFR
ncbi:hypothetical protein SAMN05216298_2993 [Glycomyces sambucus]|uniref:Uncharacterized protein n=1 Tax=Glycomyces sambucus TaxID=380244 RepID=A0A1G9I2V6_9ACTN|nr:hypothetical protein [Glycomyces sambucus]SDL19412.1 hypothetical protein SAMN05216298_2993 [Glycomyces sambucus]